MKRFTMIAVLTVMWCSANAHARDIPVLQGRVNDNASLLTEPQRAALAERLAGYERNTGHQFVFLSVPELGDQTIEGLAADTFAVWKIGDAKRDDGLLFVVSQKPRKLKIEVGYGLEGAIPDAVAARIVRDITVPAFKKGAFAGRRGPHFRCAHGGGRGRSAEAPRRVDGAEARGRA